MYTDVLQTSLILCLSHSPYLMHTHYLSNTPMTQVSIDARTHLHTHARTHSLHYTTADVHKVLHIISSNTWLVFQCTLIKFFLICEVCLVSATSL